MDNKALLEQIAEHRENIEKQLKRLQGNPRFVHELDISCLSDEVKAMYSLIQRLETTAELPEPDKPMAEDNTRVTMVEVEADPDPVPRPSSPEFIPPASPELIARPEMPAPDPDPVANTADALEMADEGSEKASDVIMEPDADKTEPRSEAEEDKLPEPKTTADLFSGSTTIADRFQKQEDKSIAARVVPQGISDLKMAIGINDKFLFINELFKGNPTEYNDAINNLNGQENGDEAASALETYRQEYTWPDNSEAYHRLKKIVFSKYTA